jgi:DNA recombination protein RmuC
MTITPEFAVLAGLLAVLGLILVWFLLKNERAKAQGQARIDQLSQIATSLESSQRELAGRLAQLAKSLDERLDAVSARMGESLEKSATATAKSIGELQTRLAVIDEAQKNITELSGKVIGLQDILANKQARGAFGEVQLNAIVQNALPPSAYEFQAVLSNNRRADCLIKLPNPPGPIVIDAKFPLESYHALRNGQSAGAAPVRGRYPEACAGHCRALHPEWRNGGISTDVPAQ